MATSIISTIYEKRAQPMVNTHFEKMNNSEKLVQMTNAFLGMNPNVPVSHAQL